MKQEINPKVLQTLEDFNIPKDEGVLCLLAIYHGLTEVLTFEEKYELIYKQLNVSKIINRNYGTNEVVWFIPLYEELNIPDNWEWIKTEYRPIFANVAKIKAGSLSSCLSRMKKFFSENPDVRKEEVLEAAKTYVGTMDNPKFLQQADYFIVKDKGSNKQSRLEQFLEIVREKKKQAEAFKQQQSQSTGKRNLR